MCGPPPPSAKLTASVASGQFAGAPGVRVRGCYNWMASSEMVCAFRRLSIPRRVALQRRHGDVFLAASSEKQPLSLAVFGQKADPGGRCRFRGECGSPPARRRFNHPGGGFAHPEISCASSNAWRRPARRGRRFAGMHHQAAGLNLAANGQIRPAGAAGRGECPALY